MSRQTASSHTPSASTSVPAPQAKRNLFGIPGTNRRHSFGFLPSMPNGNPSLAVASSPHPPTAPAGSGIPSFRALRSFLPFGGSKNATQPQTFTSPSTPVTNKSTFGFATVRRSMAKDRDRKMSLGDETFKSNVISIGRSKSESQVVEDANIRRSVSLSRLEDQLSSLDHRSSDTAPTLRTPSPGIPLSQELSTIIEADSSGVSRHNIRIPISRTASSSPPESRTPSPTILNPAFLQPVAKRPSNSSSTTPRSSDFDADTSMPEISPSDVEREVLDAMRASDSPSTSALDWSSEGQPVIIDADSANDSFAFERSILPEPDPALVALLSPNTVAAKRQPPSLLPRLRHNSQSSLGSPTSSRFPSGPRTPTSATATPRPSPPGGLSPSRSPPAPRSPESPLASTSTPAARRTFIANSSHLFTPAASSSLSQSTGSRLFNPSKPTDTGIGKGRPSVFRNMLSGGSSSREGNTTLSSSINSMPSPTPKISLSMPPSPSKTLGFPRASLDSRRSPVRGAFTETPRRPSLDSSRPRLEGTRRTSFEVRRGTPASTKPKVPNLLLPRPQATSGPPSSTGMDATPSPTAPDSRSGSSSPYRPSFETPRPSLDSSRPSSVARMRDRTQAASLRGHPDRPRTADRLSPVPPSGAGSSKGPPSARTRKRSMSVQERIGRSRLGQMASTNASSYDLSTTTLTSHPGTSTSSLRQSDAGGESLPKPDWMNARGASRVLRGVGLLKDRDSERESSDGTERFSLRSRRDRSGSLSQDLRGHNGVLAPSPLSGGGSGSQPTERVLARFGSMRGAASDYNPTHTGRALSRMAFSDVGGGQTSHRRGSGSFSTSGHGGSGNGLMESPTFTASSSSRDRETPRSAVSTAATSVSGYGGRDRDEIRDLKDRHAVEMEALLNALSDSQRTVRMLREENNDLRDRLDKKGTLEAENDELGHLCSDLQRDLAQLKRQNEVLREQLDLQRSADLGRRTNERLSPQWKSLALRTPMPRQAVSARDRYEPQFCSQEDADVRDVRASMNSAPPVLEGADDDEDHSEDVFTLEELDSSATPHARSKTHVRRGSDTSYTSSVFPMPPPNMSMIMQEGDPGYSFFSQPQSAGGALKNHNFPSHSTPQGAAVPVSRPGALEGLNEHNEYDHTFNMSVSSAFSINRTMAGSPTESLNLDPQHDRHLRDLEQVDLGVKLEEMRKQTLGRLVPDPDAW